VTSPHCVFFNNFLIILPNTTIKIYCISFLIYTTAGFGCSDQPLSRMCWIHTRNINERQILWSWRYLLPFQSLSLQSCIFLCFKASLSSNISLCSFPHLRLASLKSLNPWVQILTIFRKFPPLVSFRWLSYFGKWNITIQKTLISSRCEQLG
jgi:hypothetical protein